MLITGDLSSAFPGQVELPKGEVLEGGQLHKRCHKEREMVLHLVASCKGCRHGSTKKSSHGKLESSISFQHAKTIEK